MTTESRSPTLDQYLGRVRSQLPIGQANDILLELESTIRDRVDELAEQEQRTPDEELFGRVVEEIGEPEEFASAYVDERFLIAPQQFRAFLLYTCVTFVFHMVLVGVATAMARPIELGLVTIGPMTEGSWLAMLAAVAGALPFDIGLVVILFWALGLVRRPVGRKTRSYAVDCSWRNTGTRAVLAVLVGVVLAFFRDELFVVVSGRMRHPLFTEPFAAQLPWVLGLLAGAAVKDTLYGLLGERKTTLLVDALHGVFGVAVMLLLLRADALLALPSLDMFLSFAEPVNAFLSDLGDLVVIFVALVFAAKTVRRLVRVAQI